MNSWYEKSGEEVLQELNSSPAGLSLAQVSAMQTRLGLNELRTTGQRSIMYLLLSQFKDVMIVILIAAAVVSFFVGEHTDAYVIIGIILANAGIGFFQEYRAEESMKKLQQLSAHYALVLRERVHTKIEAKNLVPGDIVLLEAGNIIPADGRLLEISSFKTEEAALTGESHSVEKITAPVSGSELLAGDQRNMVFKGTVASSGSATMVVTAIGMDTELGRIAALLEGSSPSTPLQQRLQKFSRQLVIIVLAICLIVFGYGLLRGEQPLSIFMTALSLAVAALPEALPAVITIGLANGAARMAGQSALIRKLPAVETLGSVTYICSDKTGTLTKNQMTVEQVFQPDEHSELLLYAFMLNNEVHYDKNGVPVGDSTETALVEYATRRGVSKTNAQAKYPLIQKVPFDSDRMRMATLHQYGDQYLLLVKGAPSRITEVLSKHYEVQKELWLDNNRKWASQGLRVLFFAFKILGEKPAELTPDIEANLDFLGMAGMIDPPREEVIQAIHECKTAGIKPVMITGDQLLTAVAIAERLSIVLPGSGRAMTGADLSKLDDQQLAGMVTDISVYARVSPEQKLRIVNCLQDQGQFVAMTGDRVNDAPSLKKANIGVAMGITGTDVTKESAHMILLDDNFATIIKAVKEGRRIYDNIRKFILYVLSCNLGEILAIFFAPIFGMSIPLLPIHILWINLVTDGLPGVALAAEPAEKDIMRHRPRSPRENLFAGGLMQRIVISGVLMAAAALLLQSIAINNDADVAAQQTMVFTMLCIVQLGNALSVRVAKSMFVSNPLRNRSLLITVMLSLALQILLLYMPQSRTMLKIEALSLKQLLLTASISLACILLIDVFKSILKQLGYGK